MFKDTKSFENPAQPAVPQACIHACSISNPFILIICEDDSKRLFIGAPEKGKIRRKDMSMMGDNVDHWLVILSSCTY
jgi:cleavage and polyadenylation specificity factor subunit 1